MCTCVFVSTGAALAAAKNEGLRVIPGIVASLLELGMGLDATELELDTTRGTVAAKVFADI